MNERIKLLAEQAGFNPYNYQGSNLALFEKFAELIIRECAGIYSKIDNGNPHRGTEDYLEALQKHFEIR